MGGIGAGDVEHVVRIAPKDRPLEGAMPDGPIQVVDRQRFQCRRHDARLERARLGEVSLEMRRLDVDAADDPAGTEPHDAPVVHLIEPRLTREHIPSSPAFPAVHPLSAIGVLALAPDRRVGDDKPVLGGKELVVCSDCGAAEALRRQIDEIHERLAHKSPPMAGCTSPPRSHTRWPRTNVVRTVPRSRRPAYGVTL